MFQRGEHTNAISQLSRLLKKTPTNTDLLYRLVSLFKKFGSLHEAQHYVNLVKEYVG